MGSQSVSPSLTYRVLHSQGSSSNLTSVGGQGNYNNSSAPGSGVLGYRSSPVALSSHLANRVSGMGGPNGTPGTSFSLMQQHQQLQQAQNQFYGVVKAHQGAPYSTPSVSSRNRASQSQSILRGAASYSGGNSLGSNSAYHQPSSSHTGFQSNYSLDNQNGSPRAVGLGSGGGGSNVNYPGGNTMREREREGYGVGVPMRSNSGLGAGMGGGVSDRERNLDSYSSDRDRDSIFGLSQGGGGGSGIQGQGGSSVSRGGGLIGGGGSRSLSLSSPMGSGSSQPSPYSNFTVQHPDQLNQGGNNNANISEQGQRERFSDSNRVGSDSHLGGLFSVASHSPVTSQHYENSSLGSAYDSDTRAFPSQLGGSSSNNSRPSTSIFLRNLDSPHTSSPLLFQSNSSGVAGGVNKSKAQLPIDSPAVVGPKYGKFLRPNAHDLEQLSPSPNSQFNSPLNPSPKFDPSKWI